MNDEVFIDWDAVFEDEVPYCVQMSKHRKKMMFISTPRYKDSYVEEMFKRIKKDEDDDEENNDNQ